jgi:phosphatidylglycerophosphatase A
MNKIFKKENPPSLKRPEIFFLSLAGLGLIPKAPGTLASMAIIPLLYLLDRVPVPFILLLPFFIILSVISAFFIHYVQKTDGIEDPSWVVIDEFIGMFVAWGFIVDYNLSDYFQLFLFFRFFDIVKKGPVGFIDKKFKNGVGVILDDVVAGLLAGLLYRGIKYLLGIYF